MSQKILAEITCDHSDCDAYFIEEAQIIVKDSDDGLSTYEIEIDNWHSGWTKQKHEWYNIVFNYCPKHSKVQT